MLKTPQTTFELGAEAIDDGLRKNGTSKDYSNGVKSSDTQPTAIIRQNSSYSSMAMLASQQHYGSYESLIQKIQKRIANKQFWFSLEFFPPKTVNGATNLISKYLSISLFLNWRFLYSIIGRVYKKLSNLKIPFLKLIEF